MWTRRIPPVLRTTLVDEDAEQRKAGLLMAAIAAFLASGWYSYNELKYALHGESAEATVLRMYEYTEPTRRGRTGPRLAVLYAFTDHDGRSREDRDWVALPSDVQGKPTVRVQYFPGKNGASRLAVNRSLLGPVVFAMCLAVVVLSLFRLIREANAPIPRRRRKRLATRQRRTPPDRI